MICDRKLNYFIDCEGKPVYLTGSHSWMNFQDLGYSYPPKQFNYQEYLSFLKKYNHNFIRLWVWEQAKWAPWTKKEIVFYPMPFKRTGPGKALDGDNKFDLSKFEDKYFQRLYNRVSEAQKNGIFVSVMMFQGFSIERKDRRLNWFIIEEINKILAKYGLSYLCKYCSNPWNGHPFHRENNINGIDGDIDRDGEGKEVHTMMIPKITRIQEAYVCKVIDTLNEFDNLIWEIANESHSGSYQWQYHMTNLIREYEKNKKKQHPIGMTVAYPNGNNAVLFDSKADWVSPKNDKFYKYNEDPPEKFSEKIVLLDTDHLWGVGGNRQWVWKSFLRGYNPIFMDPYGIKDIPSKGYDENDPKWDEIRKSLGQTRLYANRIKLASMRPRRDLSSSRYCLANEGIEYLIYSENKDKIFIKLPNGLFFAEWFDPFDSSISSKEISCSGGEHTFYPPLHINKEAVLYLRYLNTK